MQYFYSVSATITIVILAVFLLFQVVRYVAHTTEPVQSSCEYYTNKYQECSSEELDHTPQQLIEASK